MKAQISVTATAGVTGITTYGTLYGAIAAINAGTHQGVITVSVWANTSETLQSILNSSGTGAATYTSILIKPATGTTPIISGTITPAILQLKGADNVTIDGSNTVGGTTRDLTIKNNSSTATETVIWIASASATDGATNNIIRNCKLQGFAANGTVAGIVTGNTGTLGTAAVKGNNNNTIQNNEFTNTQNGIYLYGYATSPYDAGWTIADNSFTTMGFRGMILQNCSSFTISGNSINGVSANTTSTPTGIMLYGSLSGGSIYNNQVTNVSNLATSWGCNGVWLFASTTASNINVYNNFIWNIWSTSGFTGGTGYADNGYGLVVSGTGGGYSIYHNTINLVAATAAGLGTAAVNVEAGPPTGSINLRNNILANNQGSGATNRIGLLCSASSTVFSAVDYNDYYSTTGALGRIGGVNRTTITQVQTGFGGNVNSITLNPTFVTSTDLHLQTVAANSTLDAGATIASPSITTDIDGDTRYAPPTMGADELLVDLVSYTPLANACATGDVTLNPVTISSATGVPTSGTLMPRIYFKKGSGSWFSQAGTLISGTGTSGIWSFTISAATMGGVTTGDVISYYIIAQTTAGAIFANPSAGLVATDVNTVITPPTTPNTYSVVSVGLTGLTTTSSVCYNATSAQSATFPYTGSTGSPNQYTLTWAPAGPTNVSSFTALPASPITVNVPAGTATGSYTGTLTIKNSTTGCAASYTVTLSVNPLPAAIGGTLSVCQLATTTLTDATTGGTWSVTSGTGSASIGSTTGYLTGSSAGTVTVSYTSSAGCAVMAVVTVLPLPVITGPTSLCLGSTMTLSSTSSVTSWGSSNSAIATIGVSTGVVTAVSVGTVVFTCPTIAGYCSSSVTVTVNPLPATITGTPVVCQGQSITLTDITTGGTWSTSPGTGSVTVGSATGQVTGVGAGTAIVTYKLTATGCYSTVIVTINPVPNTIIGAYNMCAGTTASFLDGTPGGTWASSNSSMATIGSSSGVAVAGLTGGTVTISYILTSTGCFSTAELTINPLPLPISGVLTVCPATTTTLGDATSGGTWSGGDPAYATIDASGVVTGLSAGTAVVTYTAGTGCYTTAIVTVNAPPNPIAGIAVLCVGYTTTLTDTSPGGTWSSGNTAVATVGLTSGIVFGVGAGTANITYVAPSTGCFAVRTVTVNSAPGAISGGLAVCVGQTNTLTDLTPGGTWSVNPGTYASIDAITGALTGSAAGNPVVTYTLGSGCISTATATVQPDPNPISGPSAVCVGRTITLSTTSTGISWSSNNITIATVISGTGVVSGASAGVDTIKCSFIATGCYTSTIITVNPLPNPITGTMTVCSGSTTTVNTTSTGGTWSGSSGIASIGSLTGIITGGSVTVPTTATITYTLPTGCIKTATVTVNPLPTGITSSTGAFAVCIGSTIILSGTPSGGAWSSSTTSIATVGSSSGIVTGVAMGTTTITYTISTTGCYLTTVVTVNPLPGAITGVLTLCPGTTTTLSSSSTDVTWSSNNTGIATVGATTGIVTGVANGVVTIAATSATTGCRATANVTVNPLPAAITGTPSVCEGMCTTLSDFTSGGSWSINNPAIATVGTSSGIVCGVSAGTAVVSYTLSSTGCYVTRVVTVLPIPAPIAGTLSICAGSTGSLTDITTGGSWISSNPAVVTINPSTGSFTSGSIGTATITYILGTGCYNSTVVTVTAAPTNITGTFIVCQGSTTSLGSTPIGGIWSSSATAIATAGTDGAVLGVAPGTTTITYSLGTGCYKTVTVTVNAIPSPISGTAAVCYGLTTTLGDVTTPGTWSSTNTGIAPITSGGVVTGSAVGTATISYTGSNACASTVVVTVNPLPSVITGTFAVCQGLTTTLGNAIAGGTWSSSSTAVATVGSSNGVVYGVAGYGTATITYTLGTGCIMTSVVTVNALPAAVTGPLTVCPGTTTTLANATTGGSWSSSFPAIAAVGSSTGIVTGGSVSVATTATITYTLGSTGCYQTATITVNPLPAAITGSGGFCNLTTTTLSDATPGGTWSSGTPAIADFPDATFGALTATDTGFVIITYTLPTGCMVSRGEIIILAPYPITGTGQVCEGSCTTLGNIISGGTWTSTTPFVGSITTPAGVLCGVTAGTTTITYELSNSCFSSLIATVNATPGSFIGMPQVCQGSTITLSDALAGGSWSSTDGSIAFADLLTGVITGEHPGTAIISYMMPTGCYASMIVTVNPLPEPITGTLEVCAGLTTTLSDATPGVTWSSDPSLWYIANVTPGGGVVTGINPGVLTIICSLPTGCVATAEVTVNPLPSAITGTFAICTGSTTVLDNISAGGTWSSGDNTVASIDAGGVVTGLGSGVTTITYTLPTGCIVTQELTVNPVPAISGSLGVCAGFMNNLTATLPGGIWSMTGSLSVANIYPLTGVVVGITPGTITVSYTLGTGCYTTAEVTINPLPAPISGTASVCEGSSTTLSDSNTGGTWVSSNPTIATIDPTAGVVAGIAVGNAVITYTISTGCINVRTVTVNPLPAPVTGDSTVCEHFTVTLSTTSTGGAWSSSNTAVGTVGLYTGVVTGMVAGTVNISYSIVSTGCARSRTVTVNPTPTPISSTPYICIGSTTTLTDAYPDGTWSSTIPSVATVGVSSGIATGLSLGTTIISYKLATGCYAIQNVTVSPLPNVYNVTGGGSYCSGGAGVPVNLSGSQPGVSYAVYYGSSATGYATGTGAPLTFGLMTMAGVYTVQATDALSGCKRNMTGSATVTITTPATPAVSVTTATGDTVCTGGPQLFTAAPGVVSGTSTGGPSPTYTWRVNGVLVGSGPASYSFIPANGDVVQVTMNSNATCVSPVTAIGTMTVTVLPSGMPAVSVSVDPGDTVCQFSMINYTASNTFGGSAPIYKWMVNGAIMGSGPSFSYVPTDGDAVQVQLKSNHLCRLADSMTSSAVVMVVDSIQTPHVVIVPSPGLMIHTGETLTLNTEVTNAGAHPHYQWKVNGIPVPGATNDSYTSTFNQYDSVTCLVTSTGVCADITTFDWVFIAVYPLGVNQVGIGSDLVLLPNPNKGAFTIRGTLASASNEDLSVEVTDMLGQVVYTGKCTAKNGKVDERIELGKTLANGMYMLNLVSPTDRKVFHFVMEQ